MAMPLSSPPDVGIYGFVAPETFVQDPISEDEFDFLLGDDGRLTQFEELLRMVAKNGVCANLRERVWPYLLGVFKPSMSATDIDRAQKSLRCEPC